MTATISQRATEKETLSTATTSPKRTVRPSISIAGVARVSMTPAHAAHVSD